MTSYSVFRNKWFNNSESTKNFNYYLTTLVSEIRFSSSIDIAAVQMINNSENLAVAVSPCNSDETRIIFALNFEKFFNNSFHRPHARYIILGLLNIFRQAVLLCQST